MQFQSTHPCGVRQSQVIFAWLWDVSIHAPVWGATKGTQHLNAFLGFNPRTRVGCDMLLEQKRLKYLFQSTHPCGVRQITKFSPSFVRCFNPRTRVGCDLRVLKITLTLVFQSTHPCGVRLPKPSKKLPKNSFNPRTRVGCDGYNYINDYNRLVSIHAPVWGATMLVSSSLIIICVSIHAPVWGATSVFCCCANN